jgi:hypothetical protein
MEAAWLLSVLALCQCSRKQPLGCARIPPFIGGLMGVFIPLFIGGRVVDKP